MKRGVLIVGVILGLALAVVVSLRLEAPGLAVLVGLICGLVAGLPVSLALWSALARERAARQRLEEQRWGQERPAVSPPVIILNAGRGAEALAPQAPLLTERAARSFVIVGEEEESTSQARTAGQR